ncbi:hypothetical protein [Agarivorans sp. DSG3-1]|uniref:hypothetical protein n=1 Tax=Agarivorans sp. DSG3-1 TaxID=3342249 RepID=UPI00398F2538
MNKTLSAITIAISLTLAGCGGGDDGTPIANKPTTPPTTPGEFSPSRLSLEQYQQILSWDESYIANVSNDPLNHFDEDTINIEVFAQDPQPYSIAYSMSDNTFEEQQSETSSLTSNVWNGTSWNILPETEFFNDGDDMQVVDDYLLVSSAILDVNFKIYAKQVDLSKQGALNAALNISDVPWTWDDANFAGYGYKMVSYPTVPLIMVDVSDEDSFISNGSIEGKTLEQIAELILPGQVNYVLIDDDTIEIGDSRWTVKHDTVANLAIVRINSPYEYAGAYMAIDWALIDYNGAIHQAVLVEPESLETLLLAEPNVAFSFDNAIKAITHLHNLTTN